MVSIATFGLKQYPQYRKTIAHKVPRERLSQDSRFILTLENLTLYSLLNIARSAASATSEEISRKDDARCTHQAAEVFFKLSWNSPKVNVICLA